MSDIESNRLVHSNEGSSVLNQFYGTRVVLYVEGDDDIPFWNELFSKGMHQLISLRWSKPMVKRALKDTSKVLKMERFIM